MQTNCEPQAAAPRHIQSISSKVSFVGYASKAAETDIAPELVIVVARHHQDAHWFAEILQFTHDSCGLLHLPKERAGWPDLPKQ